MTILKFTPLTKEQVDNMRNPLLDNGIYQFEILTVEDKISVAGNPMLKIKIKCSDFGTQSSGVIIDLIMLSGVMSFKLRDFCESIGILEEYESGGISLPMLPGKCGIADIFTEKYMTREGREGSKNSVKSYVAPNAEQQKNLRSASIITGDKIAPAIKDDDIPF